MIKLNCKKAIIRYIETKFDKHLYWCNDDDDDVIDEKQ